MATTTLPTKRKGAARSSIGLKLLMAGTGVIFILYVLLHMYGNLKALAGQESFDTYAHHLRTFGEPMLPYEGLLWIVRVVLILAIVGHLYAAFTLWSRNSGARSQRYAVKKAAHSTLASRTMRWGGVALLAFIVFHLIHFTIAKPNLNSEASAEAVKESPYVMISASFDLWWVVLIYTVAIAALGMHLYAAFTLWSRNSGARSQRYAVKKAAHSTLASRTMRWGGVALLAFIVFHLIHFTIAKPNLNSEASAEAVKESPYVMISASFDLWWVVLIYTVAIAALGMHLYHGVWSAAQTMGLTGSATARSRAKALGALIAAVVVVGFLIPPYALFLDLV